MCSKYLSKILIATVICALLNVVITGVEPAAGRKTISLVFTTATAEDIRYPMGVGMGSLWTIRLVKRHAIQVQTITSPGSGENINKLKTKKVDLAILLGLFGKMAWNGIGIYKGKSYRGLRTITVLWPNVEHFVILKDKVKTGTITDIKGLRFSIGRAGSGTERSGLTIIEGLGMSRNDIEAEYLDYLDSVRAIKYRRVEGLNLPGVPPVYDLIDIFTTPGIKAMVLEFTDEQLEQIKENTAYPGYRYVIPANTYPKQDKPVQSIAQPNFLGVRMDVDKEVVYLLTKTIFENPDYLKQVHKMGAFITLDNALGGLPAPLHPGAYQYYREKGLEIPKHLIPPEAR